MRWRKLGKQDAQPWVTGAFAQLAQDGFDECLRSAFGNSLALLALRQAVAHGREKCGLIGPASTTLPERVRPCGQLTSTESITVAQQPQAASAEPTDESAQGRERCPRTNSVLFLVAER